MSWALPHGSATPRGLQALYIKCLYSGINLQVEQPEISLPTPTDLTKLFLSFHINESSRVPWFGTHIGKANFKNQLFKSSTV